MPWDPAQYLKFQAERFLPFRDCLALIERRPGLRAIDLGCGTGELTRQLADELPDSEVVGIDSSAEMLAKATTRARPGLSFRQARIEELASAIGSAQDAWDLVFSHAALHWIEDHARLIPSLLRLVLPGGQLVVQMPANFHHPSHTAMRLLIDEAPFRSALGDWSPVPPVLPVEDYAELLWAAGGRELTVFAKVYPHVLPDADGVVEWMRGTALVPVLERLTVPLQELFLDRYRAALRSRWPEGPVFFGFRRIVFAARRA
jgi:trans-aconitate 2-methyltransferase